MRLFFASMLIAATVIFAEEASPAVAVESTQAAPIDIAKVSAAFGHMMCKNLQSLDIGLDIDKLVVGIQEAIAGKASPMTESEFTQAITQLQEEHFKKQEKENLASAESFLAVHAKDEGMISLEEGKILYHVDQAGTGVAVTEGATPLVRMNCQFLGGKALGNFEEAQPLPLDANTMPGLLKAIPGMLEGEKRTIHIHPYLAYGNKAPYFPPNSMLTFEIEVVKANAPVEAAEEGTLSTGEGELVADDVLDHEAVR